MPPASVAVKAPLRMPPTIRIGATRASADDLQGAEELGPGEALRAAPAMPAGMEPRDAHEGEAGENAGDDPRHEELADRGARRNAVDDHHDGRWDHRSERAGAAEERAGVADGVATLLHRRKQQRADGDHVGDARPGQGAEQHACDHHSQREAASHLADQSRAEADDALRQPRSRQEAAGEHEERDREESEGIEPGDGALRRDHQRRGVRDEDIGDRGEPERERDRRVDQDRRDEHNKQDRKAGAHSGWHCS